MFLTENYMYEAGDGAEVKTDDFKELEESGMGSVITADLSTFTEAMYFAEKAWSNLSMKMVRLEHTAIVNNDSSLMSEGLRDMADRAAEWFKEMWEKIKAFVDRVIKRVEDMFDNRNLKRFASVVSSYTGGGTVSKRVAVEWNTLKLQGVTAAVRQMIGATTTSTDTRDQFIEELQNMAGDREAARQATGSDAQQPLDVGIVRDAYKYVSGDRRQMLRAMQDAKKAAQKVSNEGIKAARGSKDHAAVSQWRRNMTMLNTGISLVTKILNRANSAALRILSAAARAARQADRGTQSASASILDSFGTF